MRPVRISRVSQPFADDGYYASRSDAHGAAGHHTGIDYGSAWPVAIDGRPVRSVMPGKVLRAGFDSTLGNYVEVYNAKHDLLTCFWHLSRHRVKVGDAVKRGTVVGNVGNTGNSTAAHLHFQVNRGQVFDYHGHIDPKIAIKAGRRKAKVGRKVSEFGPVRIRRMQRRLAHMGLYEGKITGKPSRPLERSIKRFQRRREGLKPTGLLDRRTLKAIMAHRLPSPRGEFTKRERHDARIIWGNREHFDKPVRRRLTRRVRVWRRT